MQTPVILSDPFTGNPILPDLGITEFDPDQSPIADFASIDFNNLSDLLDSTFRSFPFADSDSETTPSTPPPVIARPIPTTPVKTRPDEDSGREKPSCARCLQFDKPIKSKPKRKTKPYTVRFLGTKGNVLHKMQAKIKRNKIDGGYTIDVDAIELTPILMRKNPTAAYDFRVEMANMLFGRVDCGMVQNDNGTLIVRPPKYLPVKIGDSYYESPYDPAEQCYSIDSKAVDLQSPEVIDLSQDD